MRVNALALAALVLLAALSGCSSKPGGRMPIVGFNLYVESHYADTLVIRGWTPRPDGGREPGMSNEVPPLGEPKGFGQNNPFSVLAGACTLGQKAEYLRISTWRQDTEAPLHYAYWPAMECGDWYTLRIDEAGVPHIYHCDPCKGSEPAIPPSETGVPGSAREEYYWPPGPESSTSPAG